MACSSVVGSPLSMKAEISERLKPSCLSFCSSFVPPSSQKSPSGCGCRNSQADGRGTAAKVDALHFDIVTVVDGRYVHPAALVHLPNLRGVRHRRVPLRDVERQGPRVLERRLVEARERAARIVATAAETRADLIVMATHGRTGGSAFWEGSVTPKVLKDTFVPVLLVPVAAGRA